MYSHVYVLGGPARH